jgi:integrase
MSRPRTTNKHLPKYVRANHGAYWFRQADGQEVRICAEHDYVELYKFLARIGEQEDGSEVRTLADAFDKYIREEMPKHSTATQKNYGLCLDRLRRAFGHMRPDEVRPRDIGRYLATGSSVMRNKEISVLSAVYTKCVSRWYCAETNPCRNVERNQTKPRDRYVTNEEFDAFRALLPERIRVAMDLALLTGQRQGDILRLQWAQVSDEGIRFRQGKTGKKLLVGMSPTLAAVLAASKALPPDLPRLYVIRRLNGRPYTSDGFRAIWQRTMRKYVATGATRFTFHDIRAKTVSDSETIAQAYDRAGHTSMSTTRGVYERGERKVTPLR